MEIRASDDVSDLVKRACAEFPHWGTADRLSLYLVAAGGDEEPTQEAVSAVLSSGGRLGVGWSLERAGIPSGAWLVARKYTKDISPMASFVRIALAGAGLAEPGRSADTGRTVAGCGTNH